MNKTTIPWADFTWNPTTGCTFGCEWCYARKVAHRITRMANGGDDPHEREAIAVSHHAGSAFRAVDVDGPCPVGFFPTIYPHRLDEPLRRKKPAAIFLGSMGDVFDPAIPDSFRDLIFRTVLVAEQHTFVVLTKRADAMRRYFSDAIDGGIFGPWTRPILPNLVIGVSVTNQADADERIPLLLATPAARRMVSVEPMLAPVDLRQYMPGGGREARFCLDYIVVGGKTPGKPLHERPDYTTKLYSHKHPEPGSREYVKNVLTAGESDPEVMTEYPHAGIDALRSLRDQCLAAGVPFHYKAAGTNPALDGVVYDAQVPR